MNKKILLTSGILILPLLIIVSVFSYISIVSKPLKVTAGKKLAPVESLPQTNIFNRANLDLEGFSFTEYVRTGNKAEKSFRLRGRKLQTRNPGFGIFRLNVGKLMHLDQPEVTFYKNNLAVSHTNSETAVINALNKGITFYGNIILNAENQGVLTCDELKWNNNEKCLLAKGNCILRSGEETIRAEKIKTDVELRNFSVTERKE